MTRDKTMLVAFWIISATIIFAWYNSEHIPEILFILQFISLSSYQIILSIEKLHSDI